MAKKIIIPILIILILIGGGFFWWQKREIRGSPEDYVIKETPEGKIVENKKAGLTVKVPEGWETKIIQLLEGSVIFDSPNIEGIWRNEMVSPPLTKGCGIEVAVVYKKMNLEEIKNEVRAIHWGLKIKSEIFEEVTINNRVVLKNIFDSEILGPAMVFYIPTSNKLYNFSLNWAPQEQENCIQIFDKFLETISIR